MFDVIWTDHNRESVGQRRARKEQQDKDKDKDRKKKDEGTSFRSSASSRSSSSSRGEKPFGFLGSLGLKKSTASSKARPAPAPPASSHGSTRAELRERRDSGVGTPASVSTLIDDKPRSIQSAETTTLADNYPDSCTDSTGRSSHGDSIFSKWTEPTVLSPPSFFSPSVSEVGTKSHLVQSLGSSSYITKITEISIEPRTPSTDIDQPVSDVTISADSPSERPMTPDSPKELFVAFHETAPPLRPPPPWASNTGHRSASPPRFGLHSYPDLPGKGLESPTRLSPAVRPPRSNLVIHAPKLFFKNDNADAWKPPEAWNCSPSSEHAPSTIEEMITYAQNDDTTSMALDLAGMQREVKRMAAASPQIVLLRLKEEWGTAADAALYKELEMEKKRWMLSALHNLDQPRDALSRIVGNDDRILAFFETQATASYLAAIHVGAPVYHMSPTPLSHKLFPNIRPMLFPTVPSSSFPVAGDFFSAVHSLSLPALVPSTDIPPLLRKIHRVLKPSGTLHLVLVDPSSMRENTGPLMQTWLDENLLLNLQRSFRCTSPSKLFPSWLGDAQLRGEGSVITTVKFLAVPGSARGDFSNGADDASSLYGSKRDDKEAKMELRSVVGRKLWLEVWGQFITADKWWWDDPSCVEECRRYGTTWEYRLIEAVKEI